MTDPTARETPDLPERVVVGANGAYWRDYLTHYSMCPASEDNDPVTPIAVYVSEALVRADSERLRTELGDCDEALTAVELAYNRDVPATARETPDLLRAIQSRDALWSPEPDGSWTRTDFGSATDWDATAELETAIADRRELLRAALATPEPAPAVLDVERLARTFHLLSGHKRPLGYMTKGETLRGCDLCPFEARQFAAAYAALTATTSEATDG